MNRNSIRSYHELASTMPISYAPGIAVDINRERIKREQAVIAKARNNEYQNRQRQDATPGDRVMP